MLLVSLALALPFDDLLAEAAARAPSLAAESARIEAARFDLAAARLPMDPSAVLGADSLGAMEGDLDPTMFMVGIEQMLAGPGEVGARVRAQEATIAVATVTREVTLADLRLALASLVARVVWRQADDAAAAEQIAALRRLREAALSRHARGTHPGSAVPAVTAPGTPSQLGAPPAPRKSSPGGGMPGMPGMGGGGVPASSPGSSASMPAMAEMGGGGMAAMPAMSAEGLAAIYALDAEIARAEAARAATLARQAGDGAVLERLVGAEWAGRVLSDPGGFVPAAVPGSVGPEARLAEAQSQAAMREAELAKARLSPDLDLGASVGLMPDGMVQGVNLMVGVALPTWGGQQRARDAALARAEAARLDALATGRALAEALDRARAEEAAALARVAALRDLVLPASERAWAAAMTAYETGGTLVSALDTATALAATRRELAEAARDLTLRRAERARLESP